jgi:hypothetical protein
VAADHAPAKTRVSGDNLPSTSSIEPMVRKLCWILLVFCSVVCGCRGIPDAFQTNSAGDSNAAQHASSKAYLILGHSKASCMLSPCAVNPVPDALTVYSIDPTNSALTKTDAFERDASFSGFYAMTSSGGTVMTAGASMHFTLDREGRITSARNLTAELTPSFPAILSTDWRWLVLQDRRMFRVEDGTLVPARAAAFSCDVIPANYMGVSTRRAFFDPSARYFFNINPLTECGSIYRFDNATGSFSAAGNVPEELKSQGIIGFNDRGDLVYAFAAPDGSNYRELLIYSWDAERGILSLRRRGQRIPAYSAVIVGNFLFGHTFDDTIGVFKIADSLTVSDSGYRSNGPLDGLNTRVGGDAQTHTVALVSPFDDNLWVWHFDSVTGELVSAPGSPYHTGEAPWLLEITRVP